MSKLRLAAVGLAALCGVALQSGNAAAMPMARVANAASELATDVQPVRWVCGPFRCFWRPNYYSYYGYGGGPRYYARPWWGGRYHARPWGWRGWY